MAGRSPHEAFRNFLDPLQRAVSCVTRDVIYHQGGHFPHPVPHVLTLGKARLVKLAGRGGIHLSMIMHYRLVPAEGERGPWKVSTVAYYYNLHDAGGKEIISYQWHPESRSSATNPHLHLGAGALVGHAELAKAHLPTGRVALEDVIRIAITDLGADPLRPDWQEVLAESQRAFEDWRTWGGSRPPSA